MSYHYICINKNYNNFINQKQLIFIFFENFLVLNADLSLVSYNQNQFHLFSGTIPCIVLKQFVALVALLRVALYMD